MRTGTKVLAVNPTVATLRSNRESKLRPFVMLALNDSDVFQPMPRCVYEPLPSTMNIVRDVTTPETRRDDVANARARAVEASNCACAYTPTSAPAVTASRFEAGGEPVSVPLGDCRASK